MKKIPTHSTGLAGVYFVASELFRKGYIASPTVGNIPGIDILAASPDGSKYVNIQVKTATNQVDNWLLGAGAVHKSMRKKDAYYVFVRDDGDGRFEAFVVSGNEVYRHHRNHIRRHTNSWYKWHLPRNPKRIKRYRNNWKKLGLG